MLTSEQNQTLTRVGPGTAMGEVMRRYWVPALLSWELAEPDCPHRRVSLFWGRNEEDGLRCVYHGWKFDVNGQCVDMPSEPETSSFKDRVRVTAYPTYETGGVVWAYMGPAEKKPEPPLYEWTQVPPEQRGLSKVWEECNWLQAMEGGIDSSHSNFLHGGRPPGMRYDDNDAR